jgi:hypothetical protein
MKRRRGVGEVNSRYSPVLIVEAEEGGVRVGFLK